MTLVQEGGAVVVRLDADASRVLVVTASNNPGHWILPKGHIEPGETAEAAAVREAWEEAGVVGRSMGHVGTSEFEFLGATVRVQYFLIVLEREEGPGQEARARLWCRLDEALNRLTFADTRAVLREAWQRLPTTGG